MYHGDHPNAGAPLSQHDLTQYQKCGNSLFRHVFDAVDKLKKEEKRSMSGQGRNGKNSPHNEPASSVPQWPTEALTCGLPAERLL